MHDKAPSPSFLPGLQLAERLYVEAAQPLLTQHAPNLPYAAGLIGAGSDVLGFDTSRSMDHDWGPRLQLFLTDEDLPVWLSRLDVLFRTALPPSIAGHATGFRYDEHEPGTRLPGDGATKAEIEHGIVITSASAWLQDRHGLESLGELIPAAWLTLSEQTLLETTSGRIFRDDTGEITALREALTWYPDDIWRYRLAAQWMRIDQLEPFVGRCAEVGDDLGSQLVAITLVRDVMKLAFLMERQYAPYPKWLGTGFSRLPLAPALMPHLDQARYTTEWRDREAGIVTAVQTLLEHHNRLRLTGRIDPTSRPFHNRPFTVMASARVSEALLDSIADPAIRHLPRYIGGIDQYIDSTDAMNNHDLHHAIRSWIGDSER